MSKPTDDYFVCSHCGADVKVGANFCRECGASDEFGWNKDFDVDDDDVNGGYGEEDFDYEEFLAEEFPEHAPSRPWNWVKTTAFVLLVIFVGVVFLAWFFARRS